MIISRMLTKACSFSAYRYHIASHRIASVMDPTSHYAPVAERDKTPLQQTQREPKTLLYLHYR